MVSRIGKDGAMEIQLRHQPSFSVCRALLGPAEAIRAESGAMMAMAADTTIEAKMEGGLMKGLKRSMLGGESLFITRMTAGPNGGWVDLAASLPGDLVTRTIEPGKALFVQKGSFLCAESDVTIDTKWGGLKNLVGGEGGFLLRAEGQGELVLSCYGALDRMNIPAGQQVIVDTNHMVAFDETVQMELKRAADGLGASVKSGEGLVFVFTGPGEVMMQSRNPDDLIKYLSANMPGARN